LAGPQTLDFAFRVGEKQMRLSDVRGECAVIHYLPLLDAAGLAHLAEVQRSRDTLAGVLHILLIGEMETARAESMLLNEGDSRLALAADVDGKIREALGIYAAPQALPATIVIDPAGLKVFRRTGKSASDYINAADLFAQLDRLSTSRVASEYNLRGGEPAIKGYDPVAYFESNGAKIGQSALTSRYRGITYQFSSVENRRKFVDSPRKYAPTYGGWCATAMAEGDKVDIDPANFKITNGRLFLFYKGWLGNARNDWEKNEAALTRKADVHWNRIAPSM
jgi:YHS domain-containing protein